MRIEDITIEDMGLIEETLSKFYDKSGMYGLVSLDRFIDSYSDFFIFSKKYLTCLEKMSVI